MSLLFIRQFLLFLLSIVPSALFAVTGDIDNDGLRDAVETNTGVFVSSSNTGTHPSVADTDGDSLPDGLEVNLGTNPTSAASKIKRPNIIYILADDMGYGDVGCFWQNQRTGIAKFATPGLDAMAAQGAMLTHHYVGAPICASSRSSFLQGRSQGHADIRDSQFDFPLPNNHNIAGTLKTAGYKTIHIGKAGLAGKDANNPTAHPLDRGFDRFFGYLLHEQGHEHYPQNGTTAKGSKISNDRQFVTDAYPDLFTGDVFTAFAKKSIVEETANHPDRPFFIYLSYDTPHFNNQYPPTATYPAGLGENGGLQWTGAPSYVNTAINDPNRVNNPANRHPANHPNWGADAQPFVSMVRRMDDSISDLLQTLRDLGIDQDTLVVFTSDNGPEEIGIYPPYFQSYAGFEGAKRDLWEGGIRVPTIAWWPGTLAGTNQLSNIRKIARPCVNYDWLATFAEMARVPAPTTTTGISMLPTFSGQGTQKEKGYLYFETYMYGNTSTYVDFTNHGGDPRYQMQAIRIGDFMGVRTNIASTTDPFKIYNVVSDPKQGINLATSRPDLQERMKYHGVAARRKGGNVTRPYESALIPAVTPAAVKSGIVWKSYEGYWPWLPEFRDLAPVSSGLTSDVSVSLRSRENDVGLSFEGYLSVATAGAYTFQLNSNSSASLWLHDSQSIDNDFNFTATKASDPVYLAAGLHPIRLYYRHREGPAALELKYSGPGISLQKIPASSFFSDGPPPVFNLQPDICLTKTNQSVLVDVLANDSCTYPITLVSAGGTPSGTATINPGGVLFNPANGFYGSTTLPYTVSTGTTTATSAITAHVLFDDETWIPLNEGSGTAIQAIRPTGLNAGSLIGIVNPTGSWIPGKWETCLTFDGIDDEVDFPSLILPVGSSPRTLTCWVRSSATATNEFQTIFSYGNVGPGERFSARLDNVPGSATNHAIRLEVDGGYVVGTRTINDGQWHHLAWVVSDLNNDNSLNINETLLYVNGVSDPVSSSAPRVMNTGNGFIPTLGGSTHASNYNFKGDIDDVRIFPRVLSAAEIDTLGKPAAILPSGDIDLDNDGASDLEEFIAGTNPENPGSVFRIDTFTQGAAGMSLQWAGVAGRTYQVEESADLSTWTLVPGVAPVVVTSPQPAAAVVVPANGAPKRFLRMQVKQTP